MTNPWLDPYKRSYESIKSSLLTSIRNNIPEMSDLTEGNIFVIIISLFAAIAETIHYYIDNLAREAFLPTARRYSSVYNQAKLVDYHIKTAYPATVDVILYRTDHTPFPSSLTVDTGVIFTSIDGKVWKSSKRVVAEAGQYSLRVPLIQVEDSANVLSGTIPSGILSINIAEESSGRRYVEGSMTLNIDGEAWTLVDTFAYSKPDDKVYKVEVDEEGIPVILFGDGTFGAKPQIGLPYTGTYKITYGQQGNLQPGSFTQIPSGVSSQVTDLAINQVDPASGGSDYESFKMLKEHIPLSVKTLGVAITREDYEDLAKLVPGVDKAYVNYRCGKYVEVYITPDNGVGGGTALVDAVLARLNESKVITTNIDVFLTHKAILYLSATVTGKKSYQRDVIANSIRRALTENYSVQTTEVGYTVHLSDIYHLIEELPEVDYLTIDNLYMLPYIVCLDDLTAPDLEIIAFNQESSDEEVKDLYLTITNAGYTITDRNNNRSWDGTYGTALEVSTGNVKFSITITQDQVSYNVGNTYLLRIAPKGSDITSIDYNIPVFTNDSINLTINEVV